MKFKRGREISAVWDKGHATKKLTRQELITKPKPKPKEAYKTKIYALIIGAARYSHMPALRYADDDAYRLYAFLKSPEGGALPDEQIRILIDEDATKRNILASAEEVFARADENDVIIMYYSGHGLNGHFVPVDFDGSTGAHPA